MGEVKTVLIVDDCDTTRKILATMVKSSGHNAIVAANGLDALEKMGRNDVSLVVTDLNMPQMDGVEFVRNVRADSKYQKVPVIMITTEVDEAKKGVSEVAGVDVYMKKPVTTKWLAYQITKLI